MRILRLAVQDFRNLAPQELSLHPRTTVLVGQNGQGKTNFLEAIYLLAALRSFRTSRLSECLRFGAEEARVRGFIHRRGGETDVELRLAQSRRRILVAGKALRSPREYAGDFNAVVFVPEDLGLARGSPEGRRRFLDRGVFAAAPAHLAELLDYERALRGRNALLKDGICGGPQEEAQRQVMARHGAAVLARRRAWVAAIRPLFQARFAEIADTPLQPDLAYEDAAGGAADDRPSLEAALLGAWARSQGADVARGFTTLGPHADDLSLRLADHPLRVAGSQGQQRAFVLAMKLAEIAYVEAVLGEAPVLLLDDVGSELDELRRGHLFRSLAKAQGQVVVTTTSLSVLPELEDRRVVAVHAGVAQPDGPPA